MPLIAAAVPVLAEFPLDITWARSLTLGNWPVCEAVEKSFDNIVS